MQKWNRNQSWLALTRFPALAAFLRLPPVTLYLLRVLIGSVRCLRLLWLATLIAWFWIALRASQGSPCSQQNFPCVPLFHRSIFSIFLFPVPHNIRSTAFVPMFQALFSFCSLVPSNFITMFSCSVKPLREPQHSVESCSQVFILFKYLFCDFISSFSQTCHYLHLQ